MAGFAIVAAAMAVLATSPALFIADAWPDIFLGLEAALHWAHGHRPHEDFHTPLGAAYAALMGLLGAVTDFAPRMLIWANVVVAAFTALTLAAVSFRRLSAPLASLAAVYWTLFALSPRRLSGDVEHVAFLAAYNKWGFALVAGLWLAAAIAPVRGGRRTAIAEAVILGAALCFLFYLKLTFFAAGLAPFLFRALFPYRHHQRRAILLPVFIGAGMIAATAIAGKVSLGGYAHDILMTARASAGIAPIHLALDLQVNILLIGMNLFTYLAHYRAFKDAVPGVAGPASRSRALFLLLFILALAVNNQNTSLTIPLLAMLPLLLVSGQAGAAGALPRAMRLAMALIPAGYFMWWSSVELRAIAHHHHAARTGEGASFCSRMDIALCSVRVFDTRPDEPEYNLSWARTRPLYEELYAALDPLVTPQSRIVHFGFFNMLNTRYGLEPARGGLLFWHYGRNFDDAARPSAEAVFADATIVVMSKTPLPNSHDGGMARVYGDHVRTGFVLAAQSPHWEIYRRP